MNRALITTLVVTTAAVATAADDRRPDATMLVASVGERVVLADPHSDRTTSFATGPVGWLYPAPGGVVYAPDVIHNRTTVIDLRSLEVAETIDGLTMPHFGESPDRYAAIAGDIVVASYPDRAVMARIDSEVANPWQVITLPEDTALLILERLPDGSTGSRLSIVNLITRRMAARRPLDSDYVRMALSENLGLLALADADDDRVRLMQPASMIPVADHPTAGRPRDLCFVLGGAVLATALATPDGGGALELVTFKSGKKGLRLGRQHTITLDAPPVRLARAPDDRRIAIASADGSVAVVDAERREIVGGARLPGEPRDLRWCDPAREGPIDPDWSDDGSEDIGLDAPADLEVNDPTGGLTTPSDPR